MTAVAMPEVAVTMMGATQLGRICQNRILTSRTTIGRLVDRRCTGEDQAVVAAAEFELTARVREWRLKPLGAEAPVPQAIADAFRRSNRAVWHDDDLWKVQARGQMWESL